ncbi:metallophosphoesterase [Mucilaginibacter rubeus]|uniref:Metallophosphoesterase n=1 Tax=Mucilaginibacter rubeus TaxID=2027860 RepID=A0AAE6JLL3_9SPHI|nr:metallophosphoesterase [Mucilaginibacter rubeus]QEM20075.1 metallophosphoesterase [Mucilaginibacter gossypii]QEM07621.1 metallophosphoesterase [Mucilaginibacter rubeus]QTE43214.1 metallophosphoesterase [Mucilaginibacter rubeus]QTE49814.1 metallophosphoesterase [Mucilaginibacter rubeus]QTE54906.1 metallophosphoesterase [Mucilaginibacter rubeus]
MIFKALSILFWIIIELLADRYVLYGIRGAFKKWRVLQSKAFAIFFWGFSALCVAALLTAGYITIAGTGVRAACLLVTFILLICKFTFIPFIFADDIRRKIALKRKKTDTSVPLSTAPAAATNIDAIPRSEFLLKAGLLAATVPLAAIKKAMPKGSYDYHVLYQTMYLPNLPKAFDGLRIGQISDIHSGSFYNKKAVLGGVEMLLKEKPDLIFFTGDLVNDEASEMTSYQDIFTNVKAPLGVFSTLGNHDYGDYGDWNSPADKKKNHDDLITTHKNMGWNLLRNENRRLKINGEEIGILGIENWSEYSRFPKYGRMDLAVKNTDDLPVKLLLSHDPSHWRAEVLPKYPQIDAMFAGHTHGMQFGVRTPHFQCSPIKYVYNEWAGHYQENKQQLYVNVGFGFVGLTGRVGILPEITIFTLKAGRDPSLPIS